MALSLCFSPLTSYPYNKPMISSRPKISKLRVNCAVEENSHNVCLQSRWEEWISTAASLYPVYVTIGGVVACLRPSTFSWFVNAGPTKICLTCSCKGLFLYFWLCCTIYNYVILWSDTLQIFGSSSFSFHWFNIACLLPWGYCIQCAIFTSEFGAIVVVVLLLHFAGFFVGNLSATLVGLAEPQRRAISIELGMQNSSLGVVLATAHFTSPLVALPPTMSAVIMNIMGSTLGFF